MYQYQDLLRRILIWGDDRGDRTGTGTRSIFGEMIRFDLRSGFPAVTTKKLAWKAVVSELLWFLEGSTDERRLAEIHYGKFRDELIGKRTIWTDNADAQGKALGHYNTDTHKELGPVYGRQWRYWGTGGHVEKRDRDGHLWYMDETIDQIRNVIDDLKNNPESRRHLVSAWNVGKLDEMSLPPCHYAFQFYVANGRLSCMWNQRSVDTFLGLPFNIASYALLTHIIAREVGLEVGELIGVLGDTHIYSNHMEQVEELVSREPLPLPRLEIDPEFDLQKLLDHGVQKNAVNWFTLKDYRSHDAISAKMAV